MAGRGNGTKGPPSRRAGKWVGLQQAVGSIADGSRVFISGGSAAPVALDHAMAESADRWRRLDLVCDRLIEPLSVFDHPGHPFHLVSLQPSPAVDVMREAGAFTSASVPFSRFGAQVDASGPHPIDVAIVHVSPPGPSGRVSLGVSVATPLAAMSAAAVVIAQVNPQMPYTFGFGELELDQFDFLVEVDHPLVETARNPGGEDNKTRTIGATVAELVPDGATLQIGIGAVADAVLRSLSDHNNLSIHSGMISDGIVPLAASGALANSRHPQFPGKIVAGLVGGTTTIFDFVDLNQDVLMVPTSISHGPDVLRALPRFTAVNSAVEVDLTGAVNGEAIGSRIISGPGGAPDYASAAADHPDGQYIVAFGSSAARGTVSRIVGALSPDVPVTVPGDQVSAVVTEYGVAKLDGSSPADKAVALAAVAAPAFRAELI